MQVKCTQCGGGVPIEAEQAVAQCPYCNSSLYVSIQSGFLHYVLKPLIKEKDLPEIMETFLARRERKGEFGIIRSHRVFWPFWQIQENGGRLHVHIGATNPITDLERSGIPSGDAKPYQQSLTREEWFEPPTTPVEDIIESEGIEPKKIWLVHLPFWVVDYTYDGVTYEAWADAVRGEVYADDLPPAFEKRKDRAYALVALVAFAIFFVIGVLAPGVKLALLFYLGAAAPLYFGVKMTLGGVMS